MAPIKIMDEAPRLIKVKVNHKPAPKDSSKLVLGRQQTSSREKTDDRRVKPPTPVPNRAFNNDLGDIIKIKNPKTIRRENIRKLSLSLK